MKPLNVGFAVPQSVEEILQACPKFTVARNKQQLLKLAVRDAVNGVHEVAYDVPGRGRVVEAHVCRVKNGIAENDLEPYMRRRDPDCMVIADERPTDKPRFRETFGEVFMQLRQQTFDWLKTQELALFLFIAGAPGKGADALVVAPANAGFFALGLALKSVVVAGQSIPQIMPQVDKQKEVGAAAYDKGAAKMNPFFQQQLEQSDDPDLHPVGRQIIELCARSGSVEDYCKVLPHRVLEEGE